jgi:hypothetical protein
VIHPQTEVLTVSDQPNADAASAAQGSAPAGEAGASAGPQTPEGFVPLAQFEQEQARSRSFQAEHDRLKTQLAVASKGATPAAEAATPEEGGKGFDPEAFRRELLRDVLQVNGLQTAANNLKTEFPNADPALFGSDSITGFGSVDALRLAAMDSHSRISEVIAAKEKEIEDRFKAQYAGSGEAGSPSGGSTQGVAGDPTPEQLARMTPSEWDALEDKTPGIIQRVLRSAS